MSDPVIGKRRDPKPQGDGGHELLEPGEFGKINGAWYCCTPNGHFGNLAAHGVVEHEDGTITVHPSILVSQRRRNASKQWVDQELWHGWLERGVWRSA